MTVGQIVHVLSGEELKKVLNVSRTCVSVFMFISMQIDDARQEDQQAAQAADTNWKFHGLKKEKPQKDPKQVSGFIGACQRAITCHSSLSKKSTTTTTITFKFTIEQVSKEMNG